MNAATYTGALELAAGAVLVSAVMTLWRRQVRTIVTMLSLQGISLAAVALILAAHEHDGALALTGLLVLIVKGVIVPGLLRRIARLDPRSRETTPLVNVPASLVFAAVLIVLSYVVSARVTSVAPSVATRMVPIGVATVLVGYFMLVTRRRAVSKVVGLILVDNGIALVTFLLTSGVPLIVELGSSLDVLLVVVVLQFLVINMGEQLRRSELDQMKELHD
jgi:hydrogenase-4 component E